MAAATLITEDYRKMQEALHRNPHYGVASLHYATLVAQVMEALKVPELLDYGAGKGRLAEQLQKMAKAPLTIHHYDPAIPEWSASPKPCRIVACIDVLEHVEPELLDSVLDDLKRVTAGVGVFTVHTAQAQKVLPDGRNAHLIQQPVSWWLPKLLERFELNTFQRMKDGFYVIVQRRPD